MKLTFFFFGVFSLVGLIFMIRGMNDIRLALASAAWPSTPATIIISREARSEKTSKAEVRFRYEVDGLAYDCDKVYFGQGLSVGGGGHTSRILQTYPAGSPAVAYYDPNKPAVAVLEPGFRRYCLSIFLFGWTFFSFGTCLALLFWASTP